METLYIVIVGILFLLAISDLVVGVSNDAVNFLNSAVGSRVAPFKIILLVAAIGVLIGAIFSSGMMEIARKGIFNPQQFVFAEVMVIFLAVMISDVIILDTFNTYGLPTSTTVSLIFELLGASVAVSVIKITNAGQSISELSNYINTSKALAIISGIFLSIFIAFTVGSLVMYISRLLFSFNYKRTLRYFGGLFGGLSITAIVYFILIKGAKGSAFITDETYDFIKSHTWQIIVISLVGWSVLLQLLQWIFRLNILKVIVLMGTFALAMAFAGNDLVNFIGVPLAGYSSFQAWMASGEPNPASYGMDILASAVKTPVLFLILAGIVMVITLYTNRKARTVLETSIDLSRQNEGDERFGSIGISRVLVRFFYNMGNSITRLLPSKILHHLDSRFKPMDTDSIVQAQPVAFDLVRASVNLLVASSLIAMGTSLKLPLSTTYVTFMVAMGSSFADRAWGRETAVYRITGVLSVIGGWFITALAAFLISFILANIIYFGGIIGTSLLILLAIFLVIKTHKLHLKREKERKAIAELANQNQFEEENVLKKCDNQIIDTFQTISQVYSSLIEAIEKESLRQLKKTQKQLNELNSETKRMKNTMMITLKKLEKDSIETGHYYIQVLDYLREITYCATLITQPTVNHFDNNHKGLLPAQIQELKTLNNLIQNILNQCIEVISGNNLSKIKDITALYANLLSEVEKARKAQVKRLKAEQVSNKNTLLYLNLVQESKNLALFSKNLIHTHQEHINESIRQQEFL